MKLKILKSVIIGNVILPFLTFAQAPIPFLQGGFQGYRSGGRQVNPTLGVGTRYDLCYIIGILNTFITWAQVILFSVAVIMALYAAFLFITGKGENVAAARDVLIYVAVGVGVALLAYAVVPVVSGFLGINYSQQCF